MLIMYRNAKRLDRSRRTRSIRRGGCRTVGAHLLEIHSTRLGVTKTETITHARLKHGNTLFDNRQRYIQALMRV